MATPSKAFVDAYHGSLNSRSELFDLASEEIPESDQHELSAYGQMRPDGSTYGIAIMEQGQFLLHGTPWEQRVRYLENSPVFHLDRVHTPLLIVHGGSDSAMAPFLADEIFVGLRRLGKEVVYAKYEGEEHHQATWSYANQLDYWRRTLAWFDEHLKTRRTESQTQTGQEVVP